MSNALGIASVTHVLKDLLNDGLINQNVTDVLGTQVHVSSLPPGELPASNTGGIPSQINIFLYRVSQNTGWNNVNLPTRNGGGELVRSAPLAVNLHYLLTAFGEQELHSEILLGYAMQILHENPVLYREQIKNLLTPSSVSGSGRLPASLKDLSTSGLADQVELIKLTPEAINTEEISKLWAAFQTKYRTCTGYLASVVLIESDKPAKPALPVIERNIYVNPFRYPNIAKILSQAAINSPILENRRVTIGDRLVVQGNQLKNKKVLLKISDKDVPVDDDADISETRIAVELTNTIGLKAGVQGVQVVHEITIGESPNERDMKWASSNLLAFVLSPDIAITSNVVTPRGNNLNDISLTIQISPEVQPRQSVVLFLNEINTGTGETPVTYSIVFPPKEIIGSMNSLTFNGVGIKNGDYLVRIQVDGAESPLQTNTNGEYDNPSITIP